MAGQKSTEENEGNDGFFKSTTAFVFFVAFCKNLFGIYFPRGLL